MSMTEQGLHFASRFSPIQDAVNDFNLIFEQSSGLRLLLPMLPEHVELAAEFAALRGRQDIADELRLAVKQTLEAGE